MLDTATLETIAPFVAVVSAISGLYSIISAEFHRRSLASDETRTSQYIVGGVTLALACILGIMLMVY
jgi:sorbitol-specific phosphotransferase system component IIBC